MRTYMYVYIYMNALDICLKNKCTVLVVSDILCQPVKHTHTVQVYRYIEPEHKVVYTVITHCGTDDQGGSHCMV